MSNIGVFNLEIASRHRHSDDGKGDWILHRRVISMVNADLTKLNAHGLARKVNVGMKSVQWKGCEVSEERLEGIAVELGTYGKATKRKATHLEERQKRVSHFLLKQKQRFFASKRQQI